MSSEIIDNNETIEINETPQLLTPLVDNIEAPQPEIPGPTSPITTFSSSQEYTEVSQTTETTSTAEVNEPTSQETISSQKKPFSKKPEYRKKLRIRRRRAFFRTLKKQQMKTKPQFNPFECPCFVKVDNIPDTWDQFKLEREFVGYPLTMQVIYEVDSYGSPTVILQGELKYAQKFHNDWSERIVEGNVLQCRLIVGQTETEAPNVMITKIVI